MGLDLAFDRNEAIEAGVVIRSIESDDYRYDSNGEEEVFQITVEVVDIPGTDHCVENNGCNGSIVLRANHWGGTYKPMTDWLKEHGIEWGEF